MEFFVASGAMSSLNPPKKGNFSPLGRPERGLFIKTKVTAMKPDCRQASLKGFNFN